VDAVRLPVQNPPAANPPAANPPLADTGSDVAAWLAPLAGLLALAGVALAIMAARRRTARTQD
jgi:LPXTG-motif cell wall-anchored protein